MKLKNKKANAHIKRGFLNKIPCWVLTKPEGTEVCLSDENWTLSEARNFRNKLYANKKM